MQHILLLHGIYGHPEENWFPWLKEELEKRGFTVHIPHLPTNEPMHPEEWWDALAPYEKFITEDSIIIGHSLGVAFGLKVIEKHPVAAAYFVAPAWGVTGNEFDPVMGPIANQPFDWALIKQHCKKFTIFTSDNDPYLSPERAETVAKHLETSVIVIPGAGHFNTAAGYTEFPQVVEEIGRWAREPRK